MSTFLNKNSVKQLGREALTEYKLSPEKGAYRLSTFQLPPLLDNPSLIRAFVRYILKGVLVLRRYDGHISVNLRTNYN